MTQLSLFVVNLTPPQMGKGEVMIDKEKALAKVKPGAEIHEEGCCLDGKRTKIIRWRVTGKVKTWKTRPNDFDFPVAHGLYTHSRINQSNGHLVHFADECPLVKRRTTKRQEAIDFLLSKGMTEVPSKSRKYRVFKHSTANSFYLVGKAGAVRVNHHKPTVDGSLSITDIYKRVI